MRSRAQAGHSKLSLGDDTPVGEEIALNKQD
jgi:hypothetical protein